MEKQSDALWRMGQMSEVNRESLRDWAIAHKRYMFPTMSGYANGRLEMSIRRHVSLGKLGRNGVTVSRLLDDRFKAKLNDVERVERLGDRLLPGFHQGLLLFYPEGSFIKVHRDAPAYAPGAASINIESPVVFSISESQKTDGFNHYVLQPGDAIGFKNKHPHATDDCPSDRWCLCFFKLKPEVLSQEEGQQLSLF